MKKKVKDLKPGDKTPWYEVISVSVTNKFVLANVKFNDGGDQLRRWDDCDTLVEVINGNKV